VEFRRCTIDDCHQVEGVVIVIDVLRAFTTAAWAFYRGATDILMATTVDAAFALRDRHPGTLIMGEVDALPVQGFDLPNSPTALAAADLAGRRLIHRTTAGTQGVCRAVRAEHLLATSLTIASATAKHVQSLGPETVTLVETGRCTHDTGAEDVACADYLMGLLTGRVPDTEGTVARVRRSVAGQRFADPAQPEFPAADLDRAIEIDRFDFAMVVQLTNGLPVLRRLDPLELQHTIPRPGKIRE
jgi:2-phosphosulfolactate phosphatase